MQLDMSKADRFGTEVEALLAEEVVSVLQSEPRRER